MHRNRTWQLDSTEAVLRTQRNRILPIEGGDGSTLSLDFTTGVLDPRLTFTRASGSGIPAGLGPTYIGSDGYVKYATVANTPRFDYDPTTGAPKGLLIEAQATNLLQQSADWTVSPWSKPAQITWNGTTYTTAPDGTNTAKQITVTGGTSASVAQGIANATNRTVSVWLRAGSLTTFSVGAFDSSGGTTWGNNADSTCRIISGPGSVTQQVGGLWSITGLSTTQWTRVQVFRSSSYGALLVYPGGTGTVTGTGFMWGMQMEAGNGASSHIPTGASQATRNEDSATMSSVASLGFDQYQGTFLIRAYQTKQGTPGSFARSMRLAGSTQEPMGFIVNGVTLFGTSRNASNTVIGEATQTNTLGQNFAFGFALNANDAAAAMRVSLNGSGTAVVRSATGPTQAATSFSLNTNATATAYASLAVRSIKFWPVAKTLAELNALTTGG